MSPPSWCQRQKHYPLDFRKNAFWKKIPLLTHTLKSRILNFIATSNKTKRISDIISFSKLYTFVLYRETVLITVRVVFQNERLVLQNLFNNLFAPF
jgi:hypothetical protein